MEIISAKSRLWETLQDQGPSDFHRKLQGNKRDEERKT